MSKRTKRLLIVLVLAFTIVGTGILAYFIAGKNILAALAASTFLYTLCKPIQTDLDEWVKKDKKLRFISVYAGNEGEFANEINTTIDDLVSKNCKIEKVNVLSTKRAVIQYKE